MYMAISLGGNCVTWTIWKSTIVCQNKKRRVPKESLARISARGKVFKFNERLGALSGHYGNYPYLGVFALNCPDFTICAIFTLYMHSSIETAPLCKILEQSDHYSWRYWGNIWGIQVSSANAVWVLI